MLFHGSAFDDARLHAERLAREEGLYYVHAANEPRLIAGVATETLELLEEAPDLDVLFVPLGGGSTASGACTVAKTVSPQNAGGGGAVGAGPRGLPLVEGGAHRGGRRCSRRPRAWRRAWGNELPQRILRELLDDFILVDDSEMWQAVAVYLDKCHALSEPAGRGGPGGGVEAAGGDRGEEGRGHPQRGEHHHGATPEGPGTRAGGERLTPCGATSGGRAIASSGGRAQRGGGGDGSGPSDADVGGGGAAGRGGGHRRGAGAAVRASPPG